MRTEYYEAAIEQSVLRINRVMKVLYDKGEDKLANSLHYSIGMLKGEAIITVDTEDGETKFLMVGDES